MSPIRTTALVALCAALAVSACRRNEEAPAAPPPPQAQPKAEVTPADRAAPLTYERTTDYAEVSLDLPEGVARFPDLHATLYGQGAEGLREFLGGAQSDQTEYGGEALPTYFRRIDWALDAETGKLVALSSETDEYTGGAHGMQTYGSVLWDKALDRRIEPSSLFRPGADIAVLDRALCQAVNAARAARTGQASALTVGEPRNDWACPRAMATAFTLEPSRTGGKAGGLEFLINPYVVGPYAEGPYRIVVPQAAFRELLAPAYADEFAGEPRTSGDVTPRPQPE